VSFGINLLKPKRENAFFPKKLHVENLSKTSFGNFYIHLVDSTDQKPSSKETEISKISIRLELFYGKTPEINF
jgi:hypothetical protein